MCIYLSNWRFSVNAIITGIARAKTTDGKTSNAAAAHTNGSVHEHRNSERAGGKRASGSTTPPPSSTGKKRKNSGGSSWQICCCIFYASCSGAPSPWWLWCRIYVHTYMVYALLPPKTKNRVSLIALQVGKRSYDTLILISIFFDIIFYILIKFVFAISFEL